MWKTLQGEPQFIIPVAEAQNVLNKFASSKINFVILNVDLVASTKLSMTLLFWDPCCCKHNRTNSKPGLS